MENQVVKACEKRQPDVIEALDDLTRDIDVLKSDLSELIKKLLIVSRDSDKSIPESNKDILCTKERISSCELSGKIRELDDVINEVRSTIVDQIHSLEI